MRTDLYQGCQWNHSVVKQVKNISETKKIAVGFIRLQNIHGTQHVPSFLAAVVDPQHWKGVNLLSNSQASTGKGATGMIHNGFPIATGIRSDALGCFSAKREFLGLYLNNSVS